LISIKREVGRRSFLLTAVPWRGLAAEPRSHRSSGTSLMISMLDTSVEQLSAPQGRGPDLRFWHFSDIPPAPTNVRFEANNGHNVAVTLCLLMTQSGRFKRQVGCVRQREGDHGPRDSAKSQRHRPAAASAPRICATMKPGTSGGEIPAKVSLSDRAMVTAGLANDVDEVNQ
jgi:hypothetical protein